MKLKKFFAVCTTVLLAVGLAGVGAVSASAVDLIGTVGDLQSWSEPTNHAGYWQVEGTTCQKFEANDVSDYGSITNNKKTVTLNSSETWTLLIIKGGKTYNDVITDPQPGEAYASPPDDKGQKDVSHWIVCFTPPPPPCLTETAVSYTYNASDNSGVITVTGDADAELCGKLYVVAASWTFDGLTNFPQTLDKWNPANSGNAIQKVGTYPFAAYVNCGQGDIYSSWDVPVPTEKNGTLTGSGQPYAEHFLHQDVSPHTPNTWTVDTPSLCVVETVPAATFTDVCGTANDLVSTPDDTGALDYTETWNQAHTSVTVTVVAIGNNTIKDGVTTSWTFDFTDVPCPYTVLIGDPLATPQICANNLITAGHLWVDFGESPGFLNANLRNQVNYQIVGPGYNFTATDEYNELPPGDYVVTVTAKSGFVLNPSVQSVWPLTIGTSGDCQLVDHALLTATASMKNLSCVGGGSYTLVNTPGILWYVNDSTTATPAGTYTVATASTVTVTADIADKVNNGWENGQPAPWAFTFTDPADCLPTLAFTGTSGGNLGLLLAGGFLLFGGAIIAFERRFRFDAR